MEKINGKFFLNWPEACRAGTGGAGGKGWNLGRLERYGFRIPIGGVLSTGAYNCFIEENGLREAVKDAAQTVTLGNLGEKEPEEKLSTLREKIKTGFISPRILEEITSGLKQLQILDRPLAVRSSATAEDTAGASFAGIHESFLNVRGIDHILSAIKGCYASLWTARAVAYRQKMGVNNYEATMAVVIMEMVEAVAAGVAFACDPRTGRENIVIINANYGLG